MARMTMTVRKTVAIACLLATSGMASAGPVPVIPHSLIQELLPPVPADRIKAAVAGLAADDYTLRERAHAEILALGEKAAPQLRRALSGVAEAEARRRLSLIVQKLDFDRFTTARRVTIAADRVTAPSALKRIAAQAGYRLRNEGLGDEHEKKKVYDFHLTNVPFWEAADAICNASGLALQLDEDGTLRTFYQDAFNPHVAYAGPFRFVANQISSNRSMQLGGLSRQALPTANQEGLGLNLTVFAEPKTTIVGTRGPWVLKIVDEKGKVVPQPPHEQTTAYYGGNGYKSFAQNLHLGFNRPAKDATLIKEIRGKASLVVLTESKADATIADLLKSKGKRARGRTADLEVNDVNEANGTMTLTLTVTNPQGNPNDYQWVNSLWQRFEIADAQGEKYQVNINSTNYNSATQVTCTIQANPPDGIKVGPPATFTLVEWVTRSVDVEFSFKDIPLP